MVSTRNHPKAFPLPTASPTKTSHSASASPTAEASTPSKGSPSARAWSHTPSILTIGWLLVSLPLVIWDTGYVLLRPHSMPGGKLHWPLWTPYELYGKVDHIYGWPAYNAHNGFTAAQGSLNLVETAGYMFYLWIVFQHGQVENIEGRGAPSKKYIGWLGQSRTVRGKWAANAVLIAFAISLMTVSKTVLYWLNEAFSGFSHIGHNSALDLVFLWIIPNGLWIVLPSYIVYITSQEIVEGLEVATGEAKKFR